MAVADDAPSAVQRRRHLRVGGLGDRVSLVFEGHDLGLVRVEDISNSGLFVEFPAPMIPSGTQIDVVFPESRSRAALRLAGRVVQKNTGDTGHVAGYGVEFIEPPPDLLDRLADTPSDRSHALPRSGPSPRPGRPSTSGTGPQILLVLGDAKLAAAVGHHLERACVRSETLATIEAGLEAFSRTKRDLRAVVLDLDLPRASEARAIEQMRYQHPRLRIIVLKKVLPDDEGRQQLLRAGADQLLLAGLSPDEIGRRLERLAVG